MKFTTPFLTLMMITSLCRITTSGESDGVVPVCHDGPAGDKISLNLEPHLGKKGVLMECIRVPAGEFMMGSGSGEADRSADEEPVHSVKISKPFYIGVCEVTQKQYAAVMGINPGKFSGYDHPVEQVCWNDAIEFCKKMSAITKKTVMLPTEAQWEYACRAGTTTPFDFGDSDSDLGDYACWLHSSGGITHPVGRKKPNGFGLYDMHGNVWEWCRDWYDEKYDSDSPAVDPAGPSCGKSRVLRGGAWNSIAGFCRSADRNRYAPGYRHSSIGFRIICLDF